MPTYSSRFATNMTSHQFDGLRLIGAPISTTPYRGAERQCQAVAPRFWATQGVRCPHAARFVRDGAFICGLAARTNQILVVSER